MSCLYEPLVTFSHIGKWWSFAPECLKEVPWLLEATGLLWSADTDWSFFLVQSFLALWLSSMALPSMNSSPGVPCFSVCSLCLHCPSFSLLSVYSQAFSSQPTRFIPVISFSPTFPLNFQQITNEFPYILITLTFLSYDIFGFLLDLK